jgi:hypothetical protein
MISSFSFASVTGFAPLLLCLAIGLADWTVLARPMQDPRFSFMSALQWKAG